MLLFDCLPPTQPPLDKDHPLQSVVTTLTSRGLRDFDRAKTSRVTRGIKSLLLSPKPTACLHDRRHHHHTPAAPSKSFACPFYKRAPLKHRDCLSLDLRSVRSVKQHLIIHHHAPISCPICHGTFESVSSRDQHIVARTCTVREQSRDHLAGIDEIQVEKLMLRDDIREAPPKRGRQRAPTREEIDEFRWFRVWEIVFPDEQRPKSAHLDSPREREIVALRAYWTKRGGKLLHAALREEDRQDSNALEALQASILKCMIDQVGV